MPPVLGLSMMMPPRKWDAETVVQRIATTTARKTAIKLDLAVMSSPMVSADVGNITYKKYGCG